MKARLERWALVLSLLGSAACAQDDYGTCPERGEPIEPGVYDETSVENLGISEVVVTVEGDVVFMDYLDHEGNRWRLVFESAPYDW